MMLPVLLAISLLVFAAAQTDCPHEDDSLVSWNTNSAFEGNAVPTENEDATITGKVLLDVEPPTLRHLTIASGGKLVFDPTLDIHLNVQAIYVDGELWIGSETCLYRGKSRVTFHGNVDQDKVLLVRQGGTLELHGPKKLSWTKLAETATKFKEVPDVLDDKDDLDLCNDKCNKGLLVYILDPSDGSLSSAKRFDFLVEDDEIEARIGQFVEHLKEIANGKVVAIAIKGKIHKVHDLTDVFKAIESLTGSQTPLRNVDSGSAYGMLMIKGQTNTLLEEFERNVDADHSVVLKRYFGGYAYVLESFVAKNGDGCRNIVNFHVYDDALYRPTLKVMDDASTWVKGDKLVLASTDYNQNQAEVVEVLSVSGSNVRISAPLEFVHYGEVYKGVDFRAELGLLTRPVKFDSEDAKTSEYYGGHIKIMPGFKSAHVQGVELENLGQQEVLGSYSLHFHMGGRAANDPWLKENSIHDTNTRCVTIHNTHGVLVENNVCYNTIGHSYFLEDGSEQNNTFNRNLGLGTMKPPTGLGLIPTDKCPTTFWITNPRNIYTNNAAAGSECRGFWLNYPDYPLYPDGHTPSEEWMHEKEARFTRLTQFDNNVAHSNRDSGVFMDNILQPDGTSIGYNKYRPMINPDTNEAISCIKNPTKCVDDCVNINRFTGYKNSRRNFWGRGGCIILDKSGFSDSLVGTVFLRDFPGGQQVLNSIFIGDSPNRGVPAWGFTRSLPRLDGNNMHVGVQIKKGPVIYDGNWFSNFKNNEKYKMGAIGFNRNNAARMSARNGVSNAQFGFSDPLEGNRLVDFVEGDELFTNRDGDDNSNVRDLDGSLTKYDCTDPEQVPVVLRAEAFHMTSSCKTRTNWGLAVCCQTFGEIKVMDTSAINDLHEVRMTRDDDTTKYIDSDMAESAPFLVVLGGDFSYTMTFLDKIPKTIKLQTKAISNSNYVRVGVCLPKSATITNLKVIHPSPYRSLDKWTKVDDLATLDSDTEGGKYLFHSDSGYFATVFRHSNDFTEVDKFDENPNGKMITLTIEFSASDVSGNDCISEARDALGDLTPKSSQKRRLITLFKKLLKTIRSKRAAVPAVYSDVLAADSADPPQNYGAGSTHTLFQQS